MKSFKYIGQIIAIGLFLIGSLSSCSARNIHPDLTSDTRILTRGWTLATHGPYLMNNRGFEYSSPVLFENTLIFGSQSQGVISLYPSLMKNRWKFPVEGGVQSELLVDKKIVYFGGGDGFFYALSAETGKLIWKYEVKNSLVSRPTAAGGRLFVTTADDTVYGFDAGTGKWLWHYKRRSAQSATVHAASTPLVDGNEVIVGMSDGFVVALSLEEGTLKWEKKIHNGAKFTDVDAGAVIAADTMYQPSYDGALYAMKRNNKGEVLWRFDAGGSKKVLVEDQTLYLPSSSGTIYSLNRLSGKVNWQFELDNGVPTQLSITDRYLIFGSSHQYLYVLDKATGQGLYRWNAGDGSGFSGSPVYDPQKKSLYLLSMAGNLYQFNVRGKIHEPDGYRFGSAYR